MLKRDLKELIGFYRSIHWTRSNTLITLLKFFRIYKDSVYITVLESYLESLKINDSNNSQISFVRFKTYAFMQHNLHVSKKFLQESTKSAHLFRTWQLNDIIIAMREASARNDGEMALSQEEISILDNQLQIKNEINTYNIRKGFFRRLFGDSPYLKALNAYLDTLNSNDIPAPYIANEKIKFQNFRSYAKIHHGLKFPLKYMNEYSSSVSTELFLNWIRRDLREIECSNPPPAVSQIAQDFQEDYFSADDMVIDRIPALINEANAVNNISNRLDNLSNNVNELITRVTAFISRFNSMDHFRLFRPRLQTSNMISEIIRPAAPAA